MKKRLLLALTVVLLVLAIVAVLAACRKKPEDNTVKTIYDVSMGTTAVGTAIEKAVQVENADNLYLAFTFVVDKGVDSYDEVYEFAALLDLDDDQNCTLSFKSYTDIQNAIFTEVYYKNGTLYLNKQPAVDHAAVSGVSLSQIASTLATSAQSGQIDSILQVLPAVGDRVFSACERVEEGGTATYTFTVDYQEIGTCISYFVAQTGILNQADALRLLGLDKLDTTGKTQISFVTQNVDGVGEVFVSADCRTTLMAGTDAEKVTSKSLRSFTCKVLSDMMAQQAQYQVAMPDNLSSFGYTHPANLNLLGTLTLDVQSASRAAYVSAQPLTLSLYNYRYAWDFNLQSNVDALGNWTAGMVVTNQKNRERHIGLYYADEVLYIDLSSLDMGSWTLPAATLQDIAASMGRARSAQTLTANDYRDLILDLLVDRVEESEKVTYTVKSDAFVKLYNAVQEILTQNALLTLPPVAVDSAQLVVDTKNNAFRTLSLSASVWGSTVTLSASNPTVGTPQNVAVPQWVADCANPLQTATITPTARGILRNYTAANSNTALVEALILSLSGTEVDLGDDEIYYYSFSANVGGDGKISAISVDFDTDHNERVCSLYYHEDAPDHLYVIMPTGSVGTKTQVYALELKDEMRYVDFVRAINGNVETRDVAECTLSNTQSSLSLTWSKAGLEALLERLSGVLDAQSVTAVPNDLGLQALRVTVGGDKALRLMFAADRFIEFGIDSFAISDVDLSLETNLRHNTVSYFDAYNLPETITVSLGDGSATQRTMTVALADFDTQWAFDTLPALGSGNQMVTAHSTVLGQRVDLSFGMDCAAPSEVEVLSVPTYAAYLEDKVFSFARYNSDVSPIDAVAAFRTLRITVGGRARELPLVWQRGGVDIEHATWADPIDNGNNSDYTILPTVKNFFGNMVSLDAVAGQYTLRLTGAKITTIKNAATFLTLVTYGADPYDPFDSATYDAAELVFQTANGVTVTEVGQWNWAIESIRNKAFSEGGIKDASTGNVYSTDGLKAALRDKLYALSGKYLIDLNVMNALGVTEKSIAVTILVEPYVVREVTFEQLAEGVTYDQAAAKFNVATRSINDVVYNFAFAKVAVVTFENGSTQRFDAKDWTVAPVSNVVMFKEYAGEAKLTLGDTAGGKQTVGLSYVIAAEAVDGVGVWGYDKHGDKQELAGSLQAATATTTKLSFTFEHLNPYDYIMPAGLSVHYLSGVTYVEHAFTFAGWDDKALWHNPTPYVTTENVYNVTVTVSMAFDEKYVNGDWSFAGMVADDEGTYVFDAGTGTFVAYSAVNPAHGALARYSPVAEETVVYQKSKSGAYVYFNGAYVRYNGNLEEHNGLDRYTKDVILATPYVYVEADDGAYVYVDRMHVAYDAEAHEGLTRYARLGTANVIYREGTDGLSRLVLDPNKVDYLSTEVYPALVVVKFTDDTYAVLEAVWDLSALASVSPEQDYTETVALYIPKAQFLDDVYMRIESTKPKSTYYQVDLEVKLDEHGDVVTDEHGNPEYVAEEDDHGDPLLDEHGNVVYRAQLDENGFYVGGKNEVTLTLLGTELGTDSKEHLVVNDLTSAARLHSIICGCDKEDCKGYLYFDYGDSTTENARFAITEWKNLSAIGDALRQAAQDNKNVPLQELSFTVSVIAVAHNSENAITIHVQASNMSDITYTTDGLPLVASSMSSAGTSVYSMEAVGTALTVDPYVADIFNEANYPKELQFRLGDKTGYAYVDSWDLSALKGVTPYQGASATVYAQIATPFGNVRVAAPITVKRRIIQSVTVDGSTNRFIYVNAMSAQPFGTDILQENGRTYAQKTVEVKFEEDDLSYHMTMRYDITDYVAPYYPTALSAESIDIAVGNAAGGYQTVAGYRVFTNANYVMTVRVPEDDPAYPLLKAYLKDGGGNWDGVLYDGNFVLFDQSEAGVSAWRALTIANQTLILSCGYLDQEDALQVTDYRATLGGEDDLGVRYRWERATMGGVNVLRLVVRNKIAVADEHIDTVQYVSTETNRYINLSRGMLGIAGVEASAISRAYGHTFTVQDLLALHPLSVVGELFTVGDLTSGFYAAEDTAYANPIALDTVLTVGAYKWRITMGDNPYYRGAIDVDVTVNPRALTGVSIYVVRIENAGIKVADNSTLLSGYNYSLSSGAVLDVRAEDNACAIAVRFYDGEDNLMDYSPYQVGTYTVKLVTADSGYVVDIGGGANSFTLNIID